MSVEPSNASGRQVEAGRTLGMLEKALSALTAVLVLVAAVLGILVKQSSDETGTLTDDVASLRNTNASLERQLADAQKENKALSRELVDLRSKIDATPSAVPSKAPDPEVFRSTGDSPVTVSNGYAIDIDTQMADWGIRYDYAAGYELYYRNGSLGSGGGVHYAIMPTDPSRETCATTTLWQGNSLDDAATRQGIRLCVRTSENRFAFVKIVGVGAQRSSIMVSIVVWS